MNKLCGSAGGKASVCNAGDPGWIPGSGRPPGEGIGYPLQECCLENSMDGGAWQAEVRGVAKSRTQLSDFHFIFTLHREFGSRFSDVYVNRWSQVNLRGLCR